DQQTLYTLTALAAGQTYSFAVTAYAVSKSQESAYSNVVSQTFPADAPVASFSAVPTSGPAPLPVQLTDASTGSMSTWAWSFGDGTSSTAQSPQYPYTTAEIGRASCRD